jgi:hypothetical protein
MRRRILALLAALALVAGAYAFNRSTTPPPAQPRALANANGIPLR